MLQKKTFNIFSFGYLIKSSFVKTLISKVRSLQSVVLGKTTGWHFIPWRTDMDSRDCDLMIRLYVLLEQCSNYVFKLLVSHSVSLRC